MKALLVLGLLLVSCGDDKETVKKAVAAATLEKSTTPGEYSTAVDCSHVSAKADDESEVPVKVENSACYSEIIED